MRKFHLAALSLLLPTASWSQPATVEEAETLFCRTAEGDQFRDCRVTVTIGQDGNATLHITTPNGLHRVIHYRDGVPSGSDADARLDFERNRDTLVVRIGPAEVYEVPDRLVIAE